MFNLKNIEERIVVTFLVALIVLVFIAATLRWFGVPVAWSVDIAQLLFVWVCFIGADLALRRKKHVGVEMLVDKLPLKVQNTILLINSVLIIGFLIMIFVYGTKLCIENYERNFNTIPISYSLVTLSAPVGSFLMSLTIIGRIKELITNFINKDYSSLKQKEAEGGQVL